LKDLLKLKCIIGDDEYYELSLNSVKFLTTYKSGWSLTPGLKQRDTTLKEVYIDHIESFINRNITFYPNIINAKETAIKIWQDFEDEMILKEILR